MSPLAFDYSGFSDVSSRFPTSARKQGRLALIVLAVCILTIETLVFDVRRVGNQKKSGVSSNSNRGNVEPISANKNTTVPRADNDDTLPFLPTADHVVSLPQHLGSDAQFVKAEAHDSASIVEDERTILMNQTLPAALDNPSETPVAPPVAEVKEEANESESMDEQIEEQPKKKPEQQPEEQPEFLPEEQSEGHPEEHRKEQPEVSRKERQSMDYILLPGDPSQTDINFAQSGIVLEEGGVSPLANCSVTAQVKLRFTKPHWTLTTNDKNGNPKYVGGDEFYVMFFANESRAVAFVQDHNDGNYTLQFSTTPLQPNLPTESDLRSDGRIEVYFGYSCNIGRIAPPLKNNWSKRGSTSAVHSVSLPTGVSPNIRRYVPPAKDPALRNFSSRFNETSSATGVYLFGASTMRNLFGKNVGHGWRQNTFYRECKEVLNTKTVNNPFLSRLTNWKQKIDARNHTHIALILGSDIWDVLKGQDQGPTFANHLEAVKRLVQVARETYPDATVIWKSPTAMHILRLPRRMNHPVTYYMSYSRSRFLYEAQRDLMRELQVPFLDLWDPTYLSANETRKGDGRHYHPNFNRVVLSDYLFS